jgi:hypothetical protein
MCSFAMVWLIDIVDITLGICLNFAYYALQLASLTLRAEQGRLLFCSYIIIWWMC